MLSCVAARLESVVRVCEIQAEPTFLTPSAKPAPLTRRRRTLAGAAAVHRQRDTPAPALQRGPGAALCVQPS